MTVSNSTSLLASVIAVTALGAAGCSSKKEEKAPPAKTKTTKKVKKVTKKKAPPKDPRTPEIRKLTEKLKPARGLITSEEHQITDEKIDLGRMLYFDARLSKNHDVSCNTCHPLDNYGADGKPTSPGHKGQLGGRNSPTVYFAAYHIDQFWDGRATDVEEQALGPIVNPVEMALDKGDDAVTMIKSIPGYADPFKKAFPDEADPITYENIGKAIGAFERKLVALSPWDQILKGEHHLLSDEQFKGLKKFVEVGCTTCHEGPAVGGTQYKKMGAVVPYPGLTDKGRFDHTQKPEDTFFFKVPSLRLIEKTGPYFHDGSITDLTEAVKLMAKHQLGTPLEDADAANIVAFLQTMTGEPKADYIKAPELPESGPDTPKPNPN